MNDKAVVYDLGELDVEDRQQRQRPAPAASRPSGRGREPLGTTPVAYGGSWVREAWPVSFSLFIPGAGHALRGQLSLGLFYLASMSFLGALCWAILGTLDRLRATFGLLDLPPQTGVWALGVVFLLAAAVYVGSVASSSPRPTPPGSLDTPPPLVAGIASLLIPGWGQALDGHRVSAVLFLSGCWLVGGAWMLVSPPVQAMLDSQGLYLPRALELIASPLVRWTLPAIIWILAAYDAAFRNARRL